MIRLKNERQLEGIRQSCRMLSDLFARLIPLTVEGITPLELDQFSYDFIRKNGAKPAFLNYNGFPASLCVSVNESVIHGIPDKQALRSGDIVGLDCGIDYDGFFSDAAVTVMVGTVSEEARRLVQVTRECLEKGLAAASPGGRVGAISRAVFDHASSFGYGVVHQYCGHGVGFAPHEDPSVPNYPSPGPNPRLSPGMVIAVEPMINLGTAEVDLMDDGWTVKTQDRRLSAHFEHTIAILHGKVEVLTSWDL